MDESELDHEIWKSIPSAAGRYEASSMGRVRSLVGRATKVLVPWQVGRGYYALRLATGSASQKPRTSYVHALVLEAFVGPRPAGMEASHLNGDMHDNRASNLRWETHIKNGLRRFDHGTRNTQTPSVRYGTGAPRGHWKPGARLTALLVCVMRVAYATGAFRQRDLAKWFGVAPTTAWNILARRKWTHVEDDYGIKPTTKSERGQTGTPSSPSPGSGSVSFPVAT